MNKLNKKGEGGIGLIVMLFVGIIFAIALLVPIANTTSEMTTKRVVDNQSVSVVTGYTDGNNVDNSTNYSLQTQKAWKIVDCPLGSVVLRNGASTALTLDTDYTLDANNGRFSLLNTSNTIPSISLNLTQADYTHCADGYNTSSGARSIANITVIFSALIIFGFVIAGIKDKFF